jgi:hypothetical protein
VFTLVYNTASVALSRNQAYIAKISITSGLNTKVSLKTVTVF